MIPVRDAHERRRQGHQFRRRIRQPNILIETAVCLIEKVNHTRLLIGVSSRAGAAFRDDRDKAFVHFSGNREGRTGWIRAGESAALARVALFYCYSRPLFGWPII